MGCDIHVWVVRHKDGKATVIHDPDKEWLSMSRNDTLPVASPAWEAHWKRWRLLRRRNYKRFAALSGVRGDGPEANGWPEWAQELLPEDYAECDLHSHTHMKVRKAAKIWAKTDFMTAEDDEHDAQVAFARANPYAMYFNLDEDEDLDAVWVLIAFDN